MSLVDQKGGQLADKLLTVEEVGEILDLSTKTVHALVRAGELSCVQVTAKKRLFSETQLQDFLRSREKKARKKAVDKRLWNRIPCPQKGGAKSVGCSRTDLREEMRSWR